MSNNPGAVVPPVPEKVAIGRFAPELVEARRHGLETCIQKITNHALLYDDPDLKLFLESDNFAQDVSLPFSAMSELRTELSPARRGADH